MMLNSSLPMPMRRRLVALRLVLLAAGLALGVALVVLAIRYYGPPPGWYALSVPGQGILWCIDTDPATHGGIIRTCAPPSEFEEVQR